MVAGHCNCNVPTAAAQESGSNTRRTALQNTRARAKKRIFGSWTANKMCSASLLKVIKVAAVVKIVIRHIVQREPLQSVQFKMSSNHLSGGI